MTRRKFNQTGLLAINPSALGQDYDARSSKATPPSAQDDVAIVDVRGPLLHHGEVFFDSYDSILARASEAFNRPSVKTVVLSVDSPGGLVSGAFECATELRAMADASGKRFIGYIDGETCSAAYALLCATDEIWCPPAGICGSIGVVEVLGDESAALAHNGIKFVPIATGARKVDGDPRFPITDDAVASRKVIAEDLVNVFVGWVGSRRGLQPAALRALEANIFVGQRAVSLGLADQVGSENDLFNSLTVKASATATPGHLTEGTGNMDFKEAMAALQKAAEGEGEDAEQARKMLKALKALKAEEPEHKEPDGDEQVPAKAEGEGAEPKDEKKEEPKSAKSALAMAKALQAKAVQESEAQERTALLASRPDFAPEVVAFLSSAPLSDVKIAVETFPKSLVRGQVAAARAATTGAQRPVQAVGQRDTTNGAGVRQYGQSTLPGSSTDEEEEFRSELRGTMAIKPTVTRETLPNGQTRTIMSIVGRVTKATL